jgi:ubiquitin-conjugating enzyme E2 W
MFVGKSPEHEHVYSNGHICLSILYDGWIPTFTVESICISIISMLSAATHKV